MENHLRLSLKADQLGTLESIEQRLQFILPSLYFLGVIFYDTESIAQQIIGFLSQKVDFQHKQTPLDALVRATESEHQDRLALIEVLPTDQSPLASAVFLTMNLRRDTWIREQQKMIFLIPLALKQTAEVMANDLLSRCTILESLKDMNVYAENKNTDWSKHDAALINLRQQFAQANTQQASEANILWLLNIADKAEELSANEFSLEIIAVVLPLANKQKNQYLLAMVYQRKAIALKNMGKLKEAYTLHKKEEKIEEELGNKAGLASTYGNQALILKAWGRLEEAYTLHKKEEKIWEELGNKAGLASSYGNQALILKAWGRLEEAYALQKKGEKIWEELGNKAGLASSYGNQALILSAWGRLEEAYTLHKKEEKIKEELGNKAGLASSYGNQAVILQKWGRLEEAYTLHKKEEKIEEELGNKAGLASSYGNQALILKSWGRLEEAYTLHKKEEKVCLEIGRKEYLANSYGNQALILSDWGRLDEAYALHQKEENIKSQIGDKAGLYLCYYSKGLILKALNRPQEGLAMLHKALKLAKELNATHVEQIEGVIRSYEVD